MKETSYAVLGMGRFGRKLTTMLDATGAEILIADCNSDIINRYADHATTAVCLDLSNANSLYDIGLEHTDVAVIDLGTNLEPAVICIMIAKELGVKHIIATANTNRFGEILKKIGADEIIIPEDDAAVRMARRLISRDFLEYYDLGGNLCVIKAYPKKEWTKKSLEKLRLPESEHIRIIAIEKNGEMKMDFTPDLVLEEDMPIAIAIRKSDIYDFV